MPKPIVNLDELEFRSFDQTMPPNRPARFDARIAPIAPRVGAQKLGYNVTVIPPGKAAYPLHAHRVNEEMFFVLEGAGELRVGAERFPIRKGDFVACPPGGPETAHQILNTSSAELTLLSVSTKLWPEIVDYPESKKVGVAADLGPGPDGKPRVIRFLARAGESLDYWDGEG